MLVPYIHQLEKEVDWEVARLIIGVDSESDELPLSEARRYWEISALREKDQLADSCEERVGPAIVEAAKKLLMRFPAKSSS